MFGQAGNVGEESIYSGGCESSIVRKINGMSGAAARTGRVIQK